MVNRTTTKTWRLIDVLKEAAAFLETRGIENPRLNAERIMGHVLGISRIELYVRFEQILNREERDIYKTLLKRRAEHEPLQYILGETEFMSLPFKLSPLVLIPRPETEILVEQIIISLGNRQVCRILEIGVGSGNIAVSLAKYLSNVSVVGVDTSREVLSLARENAERNEVGNRVQFILADVKEEDFSRVITGPFDLVVSNPPYVSPDDFQKLPEEIREYEPREALCDEQDGLSFYRTIAQKGVGHLLNGGTLFFEIGDSQSRQVQSILQENGYTEIHVFPDLNGMERVVQGDFIHRNNVKKME